MVEGCVRRALLRQGVQVCRERRQLGGLVLGG